MDRTASFYRRRFRDKEATFNKPSQLPAYFAPLIGDKTSVRIAELGAGPVNTIGNFWPGADVEIVASDVLQPEYEGFWKEHRKTPIVPIEYQNFEGLTYQDESFDIVHCRNALDHTRNVAMAVSEMKRICKPGGWVFLAHAPGQKTKYGGGHYHDFETLILPDFVTHTVALDELIVCTWQKKDR